MNRPSQLIFMFCSLHCNYRTSASLTPVSKICSFGHPFDRHFFEGQTPIAVSNRQLKSHSDDALNRVSSERPMLETVRTHSNNTTERRFVVGFCCITILREMFLRDRNGLEEQRNLGDSLPETGCAMGGKQAPIIWTYAE